MTPLAGFLIGVIATLLGCGLFVAFVARPQWLAEGRNAGLQEASDKYSKKALDQALDKTFGGQLRAAAEKLGIPGAAVAVTPKENLEDELKQLRAEVAGLRASEKERELAREQALVKKMEWVRSTHYDANLGEGGPGHENEDYVLRQASEIVEAIEYARANPKWMPSERRAHRFDDWPEAYQRNVALLWNHEPMIRMAVALHRRREVVTNTAITAESQLVGATIQSGALRLDGGFDLVTSTGYLLRLPATTMPIDLPARRRSFLVDVWRDDREGILRIEPAGCHRGGGGEPRPDSMRRETVRRVDLERVFALAIQEHNSGLQDAFEDQRKR